MNWKVIEEKPETLKLGDIVKVKNNLYAKVSGFTRDSQPQIFILEIIEGFHKGEIIKVNLSEIEELGMME